MQYRNVKLNQVDMSKTTSGQNFARGTILLPEDKSIKEFKLWSDSNPEGFVQLFTDNVKYLKNQLIMVLYILLLKNIHN